MPKTPIAVCLADIHLSHNPPLARSEEPDWYAAMRKTLMEVKDIAGDLPILCAGDIFHKWNSPAELINFAIKYLPKMIAIPGNHDLPHHNLAGVEKSAYWTLVEAERITHLDGVDEMRLPNGTRLILWGFPYGKKFTKKAWEEEEERSDFHIALVHHYIWKANYGHMKAETADHLETVIGRCRTYDFALFGDNHKGFTDGNIINCGGLMRRNRDEIDRKPAVYKLWSDGTITPHYLTTKHEMFLDIKDDDSRFNHIMLDHLLETLQNSAGEIMDFEGAVEMFMREHNLRKGIRGIILKAMEG